MLQVKLEAASGHAPQVPLSSMAWQVSAFKATNGWRAPLSKKAIFSAI